MGTMPPLLRQVLEPLARHYDDPTTVEIRLNRAGQVITDRRGEGKRQVEDEALNIATIERVCRSLANHAGLSWDPDRAPKLSCVLPGGHRFECLVGASVASGVSLAIRCKHPFTPDWADTGLTARMRDYLLGQVSQGSNMIISGATNTGKTTLLNMMLATLPAECRVIGVEDTPELQLERFWDGNRLLAAREASSDNGGMIGWRPIYDHLMRATPDRVIFGEISTQNAFAALAALNAGITGFMCSIHAESPRQVLERKFDQNIAWSGDTLERVSEFLGELVDVIVQIKRSPDGYRRVTDIYEPRADRWVLVHGEELV